MKILVVYLIVALSATSAFAADIQFSCEGSGKFANVDQSVHRAPSAQSRQFSLLNTEDKKVFVSINPMGPDSKAPLLGILVYERNQDGQFTVHASHGSADNFVMYHDVPADLSKNGVICRGRDQGSGN